MNLKSLLFVPAKEKVLTKVGIANADAYIIDLEDSIAPADKTEALELVKSWLTRFYQQSCKDSQFKLFVRINSDNFGAELRQLSHFPMLGFMLPKFEEANQYDDVSSELSLHNVLALVETPKGLVNIAGIARLPWVDGIAFGAEDFTASVNMKNEIECLSYAKSSIVISAKAFGKKVFDTPSFKLNDAVAFENEVLNAVDLGFDGKLAISPRQIDLINRCFGTHDLSFYQRIVTEYEKAAEPVLVIDGKVYEKMHIERMKRILKENINTKTKEQTK